MIRRLGEWKGFNREKKRLSTEVKVFGRGGLSFRKKDTVKSSDLAIDILVSECLEWGPNIVFIKIGGMISIVGGQTGKLKIRWMRSTKIFLPLSKYFLTGDYMSC